MTKKLIKRDNRGRRTDRVKGSEVNEIQRLYAQGLTPAEIAAKLKRKPQTVKRHLSEGQTHPAQNPIIIEAQRDHLGDIGLLLKFWLDEIKYEQGFGRYEVEYKVEREDTQQVMSDLPHEKKENPLFPYTLQHCPSVKDKFEVLKAQRDQYNSTIDELASTIAVEAPKEATEEFSKFAARYAVYAALGQRLPQYRKIGGVDFLYVHGDGCELAIAGGSPEVLEYCQEQHIALAYKYKEDSRVAQLLSLRESLRDTQKALADGIEQALIKRSFIKYNCEACHK